MMNVAGIAVFIALFLAGCGGGGGGGSSASSDTIAPILTEVTVVPSPTFNRTPSYTFNSSEAGTIIYGGGCSSPDIRAVAGDNEITFSTLDIHTYTNCTISVRDAAGNTSLLLNINSFIVYDPNGPQLLEIAPVPNDYTQTYTFNSPAAGYVRYGGSCNNASFFEAVAGDNSLTLFAEDGSTPLAVGFYDDCTIRIDYLNGVQSPELIISAFRVGKPLNDTGITLCGDFAFNSDITGSGSGIHNNAVDCERDVTYPVTKTHSSRESANGRDTLPAGQDAVWGRDANSRTNNSEDGHKGFSFSKIGATGRSLPVQNANWSDMGTEQAGTKWSCVLDKVTGLMWEVKANDLGLQYKGWTYTWYDRTDQNNGGDHGIGDTGVDTSTDWEADTEPDFTPIHLRGSDDCLTLNRCDTEKYVEDVNEIELCGFSDCWRLPSVDELSGLHKVNGGQGGWLGSIVDMAFFPNSPGAPDITNYVYWSSTPVARSGQYFAWVLHSGGTAPEGKYEGRHVRLVRSSQ